jgi:hypothetical protein
MITAGMIAIRGGTLLPASLALEKLSVADDWASLTRQFNRKQLEGALATAGWTLFYMAGSVCRRGIGFDRAKMLRTALKRVVALAKVQGFNCVEIDQVTNGRVFGIPSISVSGHACLIQSGLSCLAAR